MFIDLHAHIEMIEGNAEDIVARAKKKGVGIIVTSAVHPESIKRVMELASEFDSVRASLGVYPADCLKLSDGELDEQIEFIRKNAKKIVSIGEVGFELKEAGEIERQKKNFEKFIDLAIELDKPVIVHSRKGELQAIEVLESKKAKKVVMHCFNGNFKLVERVKNNGWYLTVPTNITYSEHFQKIAKEIPIEQLFCETDSPFLHPIKGTKNNEPGNVIESYKKIAEIKKMKLEDVERKIEQNYKKLFD